MNRIFTRVLIVLDICAVLFLFVVYGPVRLFPNWFVTTALTTGEHKYLAYILYTEKMVDDILEDNRIVVSDESTDESLISFTSTVTYANEYERQILEHDEDELYKMIEISGSGYSGWITVIYDPSRLHLAVTEDDSGETVSEMAERYDAMVAINGGGYASRRGEKNSCGGLVADGEVLCEDEYANAMVTMTEEGKLVLTYSPTDRLSSDTDWAVYFEPFLIVNGVRSEFQNNAGGTQPRTAIGQRSDGVVLLVTIDGRGSNGSMGINYSDLTDIFERYGCINAANLDGGGSTTLVVEGELINEPASFRDRGERNVFDAIVYY